jgi:hypothetical protein
MPNDLDTIVQLEEKIHQLPPHLVADVDDFISFLLKKHSIVSRSQQTPVYYQVKSVSLGVKMEISDAEIEAVCGLYQADCTVSLEKMEEL